MSFRRSLDGAEKCALRVLRRDEVTEDEYFIARVVKRRSSIAVAGLSMPAPGASVSERRPYVREGAFYVLCVCGSPFESFLFFEGGFFDES